MFYLVINKGNAGKEAVERLQQDVENGEEELAKIELKGKTIYIYTKSYLELQQK